VVNVKLHCKDEVHDRPAIPADVKPTAPRVAGRTTTATVPTTTPRAMFPSSSMVLEQQVWIRNIFRKRGP